MRQGAFLIPGLLLLSLIAPLSLIAGPLESANHPHHQSMSVVHEAEHDVDHAWETYHRVALGGTVASPSLQAEIEEHLHEARTLIAQAQEAAEHGDEYRLGHLIKQAQFHTARAREGSKEQKR